MKHTRSSLSNRGGSKSSEDLLEKSYKQYMDSNGRLSFDMFVLWTRQYPMVTQFVNTMCKNSFIQFGFRPKKPEEEANVIRNFLFAHRYIYL